MNDKKILEKVYGMVSNGYVADIQDDVKTFIEQEWQKRDEQELADQYNRNREAKDHVSTVNELRARNDDWFGSDPCTDDVKEIERHRGLEISEDGTVTDLR